MEKLTDIEAKVLRRSVSEEIGRLEYLVEAYPNDDEAEDAPYRIGVLKLILAKIDAR